VKAAAPNENVFPTEEVSMSYAAVSWEYVPMSADGKPGQAVRGGWNVRQNVAK
jgi:type VI protein secretion system component Hcp